MAVGRGGIPSLYTAMVPLCTGTDHRTYGPLLKKPRTDLGTSTVPISPRKRWPRRTRRCTMFDFLSSDSTLEHWFRSLSYRRPPRPEPDDATLRNWAEGPTIAISRQVGARGTTIARVVGAKL